MHRESLRYGHGGPYDRLHQCPVHRDPCRSMRTGDSRSIQCTRRSIVARLTRHDIVTRNWQHSILRYSTAAGKRSYLIQRPLVPVVEICKQLLRLFQRHVSPMHQSLCVQFPDRSSLVNGLVHTRLGVTRIVTLIVPMPPVTDHIDDDILVKLLPEGKREHSRPSASLGVVPVHMEDRRLHHFRDICRIHRRTS